MRTDFGLQRVKTFAEINPDREVQARLREAYESVDDIDAWVGGLSEPALSGGARRRNLATWHGVLSDQFVRLRAGDRFWYQTYLTPELIALVEQQTLATIIRRNTEIDSDWNPAVKVA